MSVVIEETRLQGHLLGKYLRARRHVLGLSQQAVAAAAGINRERLQKYESGGAAYLPTPAVLRGLAGVLQCDLQDLVEAAGYVTSEEVA